MFYRTVVSICRENKFDIYGLSEVYREKKGAFLCKTWSKTNANCLLKLKCECH